jgi:hypothetical protein
VTVVTVATAVHPHDPLTTMTTGILISFAMHHPTIHHTHLAHIIPTNFIAPLTHHRRKQHIGKLRVAFFEAASSSIDKRVRNSFVSGDSDLLFGLDDVCCSFLLNNQT